MKDILESLEVLEIESKFKDAFYHQVYRIYYKYLDYLQLNYMELSGFYY